MKKLEKRIKDILTDEELERIHNLKKALLRASTKIQMNLYQKEFDQIIEKAKERYFKCDACCRS